MLLGVVVCLVVVVQLSKGLRYTLPFTRMSTPIDTYLGQRVVFANKDAFLKKVDRFKESGPSKLSVVSDFDFTISKFMLNGNRAASCHKVIEDCGLLSPEYHDEAQALQKKYYPLEVDPSLSMEEKTKHMIDWVDQAHKILIENGLTKEVISQAIVDAVKNQKVALREKVADFFNVLTKASVPTLIFSAGIADILEEILNVEIQLNWDHVHVISNKCVFGSDDADKGKVVDFAKPFIHVFNKKSSTYLHTEFFQCPGIEERKCLLLLGDSLGDVSMSEGMDLSRDAIIRVGFLNDRVEERLPQYLENFDVVVLDDPGFDIPLHIVELVCGGGKGV
jgi:cytosolic 5'-nucleotidase 3